MTKKPQNENHYKSANQVIQKLEFLSHVDASIVQMDSEEMKEETHELEQVEQDEQEETREIEDQE